MSMHAARRRKLRTRSIELLEDRRVMSADSLGELLGEAVEHQLLTDAPLAQSGGLQSEPPALAHHGQRDGDFWLDSDAERDSAALLGDVEQTLASAHGATGLTQVRNNYGFIGTGQTVAVIDSGIAYDHYALGGGIGANYRVVGGWDFTEENEWNPYDDGSAGSHGTHVSGIVGADRAGTADDGVAPGVNLVGLRVFNDAGVGYFSWVENALRWVHQNRNAYANPITAVNLSIGTTWNSASVPLWSTMEDEFAQLKADGIFVTVSAGNSFTTYNTTGLSYPAASPYVVPVMSTDDGGGLSYFSQRHSRAIAAPGRWIVSTIPDYTGNLNGVTDDFASYSGTSMAAPYVAGASVLLREAMQFVGYTNITQDTIFNHMMATADSFFDAATNQDYKRLNLTSAFNALMPTDDFGSSAAAAYNLGTLSSTSTISGLIGKLSDADYFQFTAAATGTVSFTADTTHSLAPVWTASGGTVSGTNGETYTFQVVAGQAYTLGLSTGGGIGYYDLSIDAASGVANSAPVLTAIGNKSANEGSLLSFTATASDPDAGQSLTFSLGAGAPAGASIHPTTGIFSWTPSESQGPGNFNLTIRVTDNGAPNLSDSETISIAVSEVNAAPVLAAIGSKSVVEGSLLTFTATATDPDLPANGLTFSLGAGAPAGAAINPTTGVFTWIPTANQGPAVYSVTIRVTDNGSSALNDWETFSITVTDPPPQEVRYFSTTTGGWLTGSDNNSILHFNSDIVKLTIEYGGAYRYGMYFDGSDVGLATGGEDIDAFTFLPDGSILVSMLGPFAVSESYSAPGIGGGAVLSGVGHDLLRFTPNTLGDNTTGTWSFYLDGSDVGLTRSGENIDSIGVLFDGRLLISTAGGVSVPGAAGKDEDLLAFAPSALSATTMGTWAMYCDGSDIGLTSTTEDVDALFVSEQASGDPTLYFSTRGNFAVAGASGANEDVFAFAPTQLGSPTWGAFETGLSLDGSQYGLYNFDLDGIYFGLAPGEGLVERLQAPAGTALGAGATSVLPDARSVGLRLEMAKQISAAVIDSPMSRSGREVICEPRSTESQRPVESLADSRPPVSMVGRGELLSAWSDAQVMTGDSRNADGQDDLFSKLSEHRVGHGNVSIDLVDRVFYALGSNK